MPIDNESSTSEDRFSQQGDGRYSSWSSVRTSPWQLFDAWVKVTRRAASTINRWRVVFLDLEQRFESASDISEDDARGWSRQLVITDSNDSHIARLSAALWSSALACLICA